MIMKQNYTTPKFDSDAFNCPYCGAFANMSWYAANFYRQFSPALGSLGFSAAQCSCCGKSTVWEGETMIIPSSST